MLDFAAWQLVMLILSLLEILASYECTSVSKNLLNFILKQLKLCFLYYFNVIFIVDLKLNHILKWYDSFFNFVVLNFDPEKFSGAQLFQTASLLEGEIKHDHGISGTKVFLLVDLEEVKRTPVGRSLPKFFVSHFFIFLHRQY